MLSWDTDILWHMIDTGDSHPIRQQPYRTPVVRRGMMRDGCTVKKVLILAIHLAEIALIQNVKITLHCRFNKFVLFNS